MIVKKFLVRKLPSIFRKLQYYQKDLTVELLTKKLLKEALYIKNYHFIRLGGYDQTKHITFILLKRLYTGDSPQEY